MTATTRKWKDIPLFKRVSDEEWNDYRWQLRNRLSTVEDFEQLLNMTSEQRKDLEACMGKFRVAVTPYYASLMDPDDPKCPVRMQGVPSTAEMVVIDAGASSTGCAIFEATSTCASEATGSRAASGVRSPATTVTSVTNGA